MFLYMSIISFIHYHIGTVYEFGTPEYEELLPPSKRQIGSRSVIMIDVLKVGTVNPLTRSLKHV